MTIAISLGRTFHYETTAPRSIAVCNSLIRDHSILSAVVSGKVAFSAGPASLPNYTGARHALRNGYYELTRNGTRTKLHNRGNTCDYPPSPIQLGCADGGHSSRRSGPQASPNRPTAGFCSLLQAPLRAGSPCVTANQPTGNPVAGRDGVFFFVSCQLSVVSCQLSVVSGRL